MCVCVCLCASLCVSGLSRDRNENGRQALGGWESNTDWGVRMRVSVFVHEVV